MFSYAMFLYEMISLFFPFEKQNIMASQIEKLTIQGERPPLHSRVRHHQSYMHGYVDQYKHVLYHRKFIYHKVWHFRVVEFLPSRFPVYIVCMYDCYCTHSCILCAHVLLLNLYIYLSDYCVVINGLKYIYSLLWYIVDCVELCVYVIGT